MTFSEVIQNLAGNIIVNFDEVYTNAEIVNITDAGKLTEKFPAVSVADEWINLVPTDQRETIYIRRNGDDEVVEELKLGSCVKSYRMRSQLRIVFFKDHAKNHNEIIAHLMQAVLVTGTKLKSIIRDKWRLQKDESSGDYNFGATTAYFAIDIYALWTLQTDTCEEDFCIDIQNPLRKNEVVEIES